MKEKKLIYNAIKTPDGTILHSKRVHDFVSHNDKNGKQYAVDGGNEYQRVLADEYDYEDVSVYDDGNHQTRINHIVWGKNYDKDMKRLPETEWITIKDMDTDHIKAIVDGGYADGSPFYHKIFIRELEERKHKNN